MRKKTTTLQTIRSPGGDELVVLPRADYEALLALAEAAPATEEDDIAGIVDRTNGEPSFPEEVWARLEAGEHPVRVFRTLADMTQLHLAMRLGVTQSTIASIENRSRKGTVGLYAALAKELKVPLEMLVEE